MLFYILIERGDFKPIPELLAATIIFCKSSAGLSEVTRARDKLGVFPSQASQEFTAFGDWRFKGVILLLLRICFVAWCSCLYKALIICGMGEEVF